MRFRVISLLLAHLATHTSTIGRHAFKSTNLPRDPRRQTTLSTPREGIAFYILWNPERIAPSDRMPLIPIKRVLLHHQESWRGYAEARTRGSKSSQTVGLTLSPLWRGYAPAVGEHYWSTDPAEVTWEGSTLEGISGHGYADASDGAVPIRLWFIAS